MSYSTQDLREFFGAIALGDSAAVKEILEKEKNNKEQLRSLVLETFTTHGLNAFQLAIQYANGNEEITLLLFDVWDATPQDERPLVDEMLDYAGGYNCSTLISKLQEIKNNEIQKLELELEYGESYFNQSEDNNFENQNQFSTNEYTIDPSQNFYPPLSESSVQPAQIQISQNPVSVLEIGGGNLDRTVLLAGQLQHPTQPYLNPVSFQPTELAIDKHDPITQRNIDALNNMGTVNGLTILAPQDKVNATQLEEVLNRSSADMSIWYSPQLGIDKRIDRTSLSTKLTSKQLETYPEYDAEGIKVFTEIFSKRTHESFSHYSKEKKPPQSSDANLQNTHLPIQQPDNLQIQSSPIQISPINSCHAGLMNGFFQSSHDTIKRYAEEKGDNFFELSSGKIVLVVPDKGMFTEGNTIIKEIGAMNNWDCTEATKLNSNLVLNLTKSTTENVVSPSNSYLLVFEESKNYLNEQANTNPLTFTKVTPEQKQAINTTLSQVQNAAISDNVMTLGNPQLNSQKPMSQPQVSIQSGNKNTYTEHQRIPRKPPPSDPKVLQGFAPPSVISSTVAVENTLERSSTPPSKRRKTSSFESTRQQQQPPPNLPPPLVPMHQQPQFSQPNFSQNVNAPQSSNNSQSLIMNVFSKHPTSQPSNKEIFQAQPMQQQFEEEEEEDFLKAVEEIEEAYRRQQPLKPLQNQPIPTSPEENQDEKESTKEEPPDFGKGFG